MYTSYSFQWFSGARRVAGDWRFFLALICFRADRNRMTYYKNKVGVLLQVFFVDKDASVWSKRSFSPDRLRELTAKCWKNLYCSFWNTHYIITFLYFVPELSVQEFTNGWKCILPLRKIFYLFSFSIFLSLWYPTIQLSIDEIPYLLQARQVETYRLSGDSQSTDLRMYIRLSSAVFGVVSGFFVFLFAVMTCLLLMNLVPDPAGFQLPYC